MMRQAMQESERLQRQMTEQI
jgi:hypothetical protein